ncbi:MAG: type II secretion system protein [Peptococcaceae bacterium]|nr:type II secretion system protein [Peptococcaceae bacterium]
MEHKLKQHDGFTLIEVVVTVVIMSLLMTLAMPAIKQSYTQLQMDTAIIQLHKDIRCAQKLADSEQSKISIVFLQDNQPYRYIIKYASGGGYIKTVEFPDNLTGFRASTLFINPDKTFKSNGHVLIQKGEIRRYVYYYQTGRSRVTSIPD